MDDRTIRIVSKRSVVGKTATAISPVDWSCDDEPYVLDVTSKSNNDFGRRLSPFFPHGGIPIPGTSETSRSVEGVWQGLKHIDGKTDPSKFTNATGRNLKRRGKTIRGHVLGDEIIGYVEARKKIYVPTYEWMLSKLIGEEWEALRRIQNVVLVDYDVNEDVEDTRRPLSHASLVKKRLLAT